ARTALRPRIAAGEVTSACEPGRSERRPLERTVNVHMVDVNQNGPARGEPRHLSAPALDGARLERWCPQLRVLWSRSACHCALSAGSDSRRSCQLLWSAIQLCGVNP